MSERKYILVVTTIRDSGSRVIETVFAFRTEREAQEFNTLLMRGVPPEHYENEIMEIEN